MHDRRTGWAAGAAGLAVSLAATGLLWAQSQPKFPVPIPAPKTAQQPPTPSAAPAPAAPPAAAPSAPAGPRDPFEPLVKKPEPGEQRLQEIAGLRLVGVLWEPRNPADIQALVETPDGLGYYLRPNEERFGGRVVAVDRDRVQFQVRERVPGAPSRLRTIELRLPKPAGQ